MHREHTAGCGQDHFMLCGNSGFHPWHKWPILISLHEKPNDECDMYDSNTAVRHFEGRLWCAIWKAFLMVCSLKYAQKTKYVQLRAWISSAHAKSGINARGVSTPQLQDQGLMGNALLHENKMDKIVMSFYLPRAWKSKNQRKENPQQPKILHPR